MQEQIKEECLKRLRILKLSKDVVKEFKINGKVYCSQPKKETRELTTEELTLVALLEQKENVIVYHTLKIDNDTFYLYVGENPKEWKDEKTDLRLGYAVGKYFDIIDRTLGIEIQDGKVEKIYK